MLIVEVNSRENGGYEDVTDKADTSVSVYCAVKAVNVVTDCFWWTVGDGWS